MLTLLAIVLGPKAADAQPPTIDRMLELDVVVNGHGIGMIGDFQERHGKLFAARHELDSLGFKTPRPPAANDNPVLPLSKLPGVTYRLDEGTQTLFVTAVNAALKPTLLALAPEEDLQGLAVESGLGAVLNYNIVGAANAGQTVAEALLDARVFSPWGVTTSSFVATQGTDNTLPPLLRLDSTYTYSDPATLRRYSAGDFITGGLPWTRPVRLGGIQVSTDFGIRPDLVTFPVPTIAGQVAVPSSVDVLVNGVQLLSQNVPAGPFEIPQLPVVTGAGNVSVVVRDSVGQQTVQTLPIYSSALLLAPGFSAYSVEMGSVRLNYGLESDDYESPAASASYRRGVLNWLTFEGHAEGSGGANQNAFGGPTANAGGMAGGGASFTVARLGVMSLDVAGSSFGGQSGSLISAAFERVTPILSLSASVQVASTHFGDIASVYGDPVPQLQTRASAGLALGRFGSFGVAYVGVQRAANTAAEQTPLSDQQSLGSLEGFDVLSLLPATRVALLSTSYSRSVLDGRAYVYATAFHDFASSSSSGVMVGMTIPFGQRGSAGVSAGTDASGPSETIQASQAANSIGDAGWQVLETTGDTPRQVVVGSYKSPWALATAGADRIDGQTAFRGSVQGALAYADEDLFASNTIYDSFAVVDTDKTAGVEVLQENRPVGRTGASGLVLVPDLRSFDANRIGIDPTDVSVDSEVGETSRMVRPQDHSGVVVHFPIHVTHGAIVRLTDEAGKPIAVGSGAQLVSPTEGDENTVGYDGEAYVSGLGPHNRVVVTKLNGDRCSAAFEYKRSAGILPTIGPILCKAIAS